MNEELAEELAGLGIGEHKRKHDRAQDEQKCQDEQIISPADFHSYLHALTNSS